MIDHYSSYATDYDRSKAFYDAVLPALGYPCVRTEALDEDPLLPGRRIAAFGPGHAVFWVIEVREAYTPRHVAFAAADRAGVDRFHAAGLDAGGRDNGAPGLRPGYHAHYYGAFLIDPDGNNVEAVVHEDRD